MTLPSLRPIAIALVSPGDVQEEREIVKRAIDRLRPRAEKYGLTLSFRKWEDVSPGFDLDGAQARIDKHIQPADCDLVIAVWWKRYGSVDDPPYSRTALEIKKAIQGRRTSEKPRK
jgi:hypothetical protein